MQTLAELSIKNFRAIKRADIQLDGITVVSGVNGCGKSTISKLLYYILRNANAYEKLVKADINNQIRPYLRALDQIQFLAFRYERGHRMLRRIDFDFSSVDDVIRSIDVIRELCKRFLEFQDTLQR